MKTTSSLLSSSSPDSLSRRRWLARSSAGLAGALGLGTVGNLFVAPRTAYAADYKALVCVFLYGGNDGLNCIVPTDARHAQYAGVRAGLAIPQAALRPLAGSAFGLHPSLSGLLPAWNDGRLAPVFNVGPLNRPLTKTEFRSQPNASEAVPDNLFSHSDQQILWETGSSRSLTRTGWGGRASEALATVNPVISLGGSPRFGQTLQQSALVLPAPGEVFGAHEMLKENLSWEPNALRKAALDALYAQSHDQALADAFSATQKNAFTLSDRLIDIVKVTPGDASANAAINAAFAPLINAEKKITTNLGRQLYQTAKLIHGNATVLGNRQMFFTQMGGFDTHANQVITDAPTEGAHARLLKELGDALGCFYAALKALGLDTAVTTFTQSDFGRTFAPNQSTGTDHGWGNHHLVMGGGVNGGKTYGAYPELELGGNNDVGVESWERQGRWLPTTAVDQYAATLLGWFGASDSQLLQVLPNLGNFSAKKLGFV